MNLTSESLADILESNGHATRIVSSGDVCICCPFCDDQKYKNYVHPERQFYHCFKCEKKGTVRGLFNELGIKAGEVSLSTGEMRDRIIKARVNKVFSLGKRELPKALNVSKLPKEYIALRKGSPSIVAEKAYAWLNRRGLNWDDVKEWDIGYCAGGPFSEHLILPVRDDIGTLITFQARRFIGTIDPKSKNPYADDRTISKTDVLYGQHKVRLEDSLVIVEGPFDVIALNKRFREAQLEQYKTLALFGHQISKIQTQLLVSMHPAQVFVMMDSDAVYATYQISKELAGWLDKVYAVPLEKGDPDDLDVLSLLEKMKHSEQIFPKHTSEKSPSHDGL